MLKNKFKSMKGFSLVEVLVAMAIMGAVGVDVLIALVTSSKSFVLTDTKETARNLAETQMEQIKSQPIYQEGSAIITCPPGYSVTINPSDARDMNLRKFEITVFYQGKPIFSLVDYKKY
jgi:prepilin-type N-terminal cleavage/methylation domain-containing protein